MKFGVVGLGNHALNRIMPAILESRNEISALTTQNEEKGLKLSEQYKCVYSKTLNEMLNEDIDAVYVGSPNYLHYEHARKSLMKDKHVLMEKQMTLRSSEAKELMTIANERKLKIGVGFHLRFQSGLEFVRKELETEGSFVINGRWCHESSHSMPTEESKWWTENEKVGGGSIMGTGVHVIDTIVSLFGKFPRKITAFRAPDQRLIDDTMMVNMQFERGFGSAFSSREIKPVANDLNVLTKNDNILCRNFFSTGSPVTIFVNGEKVEEIPAINPYVHEISGFKEYVFGNPSNIATGNDGYRVVRIVEDSQKFISMVR